MDGSQQPFPSSIATAGSGDLLFAILESLPFRICVCDREGRCVLQNEISLRDFGSLVGRFAREFPWPPDDVHRWAEQTRRALVGGIVWSEPELLLGGRKH